MTENPKCEHCNHPKSFHRSGQGCQVGACSCKTFKQAKAKAASKK